MVTKGSGMGKAITVIGIVVIWFYAPLFCMQPRAPLPSLKQLALNKIVTNLHTFSAKELHNLPLELVQELISTGSLLEKNPVLFALRGTIGTIKISSLPINCPRIVPTMNTRYTNLIAFAGAVAGLNQLDSGERKILFYRVAKHESLNPAYIRSHRPVFTASSPREAKITCFAIHPTKPIIAWGCSDGTVSFMHLPNNEVQSAYGFHNNYVESIGFDPLTNCILSGDRENTVGIWPYNLPQPTIKIRKACILFLDNPIEEKPIIFANHAKIPSCLLNTNVPSCNHMILELAALQTLLALYKTKDPKVIKRFAQSIAYVEELPMDASSQEIALTNIQSMLEDKRRYEEEDEKTSLQKSLLQLKK